MGNLDYPKIRCVCGSFKVDYNPKWLRKDKTTREYLFCNICGRVFVRFAGMYDWLCLNDEEHERFTVKMLNGIDTIIPINE